MTDIIIANGKVKLAASVFGSENAPDVLCLHGISMSRDTWEETVDRLKDRCRVWTIDFRGHGHSDRADRYLLEDYASDAAVALETIGRPTVVIGHSLGGATAALLSQIPHTFVKAVFLEDPPYFTQAPVQGEPDFFKMVFTMLRDKEIEMQTANAPLSAYVEMAKNMPSPLGGKTADHSSDRHILSIASALQRQDPASWEPALDRSVFATFNPAQPIKVPAKIIQADGALGAAFGQGHEKQLLEVNPSVEVVCYKGASHMIHVSQNSASRFLDDVDNFVTKHING